MRSAALQFCPEFLAVESNQTRVLDFIRTCDAELLVLPELCFTGYFFHDSEQLRSVAEATNGPSVTLLRDVARSRKVIIVAGIAERAGENVYNSAVTVLPDGSVDVYRKTHLFAEEKILFTPGDSGFRVRDFGSWRLGVMICYDWRFPEAARTLALKGAHIIAHPSDLVAAPELWQPAMRVRSLENRVFTITANRTGRETRGLDELIFHGCSQIVAPSGKVLVEAGREDEGWIYAEIDPTAADRKAFSQWNDIMTDRRPDLYEL
ncbi:MAG: acyltransferase [Bacteroidia bacterium]|nr:acyltransferase [Bacteroidia bacterium]